MDHLRVQFQKIKATKLHYFLYCSSNVNSVTTVRRRHIFSVEKTVREGSSSKSHFSFSPCQPILVKWHNVEKMHHRSRRNTYFQLLIVFVYWGAATTLPLVPVLIQMRTHWVEIVLIWNTKRMPYESRYSNREPSKSSFFYFVTTVKLKKQALHAGQGTHGDAVIWIRSDIFFLQSRFLFFSCLGFQRGGPVSCHGPLGNNKLHTASPSNLVWPFTVIKTILGESQTLLSQDLPFAKCIGVSNIVKLHRQNRISHF